MKIPSTLAALFSTLLLTASPFLELSEFTGQNHRELGKINLAATDSLNNSGITLKATTEKQKNLTEYLVSIQNDNAQIANLRVRFSVETNAKTGGSFFDGFEYHQGVDKSINPATVRYIFPLASYLAPDGALFSAGFSPATVSSRFERQLVKNGDNITLIFDNFVAVNPGESVSMAFVAGMRTDARHNVESVEDFYLSYPAVFRPVPGADERIYGVGGYFFSNDNQRLQQLEEARRFGFSWEWYYNSYQKAGDFYPSREFWDDKIGYKTEKAHAACDTPGSVEDWQNYNRQRIKDGNRTSALFFYYMQQYVNSDLGKTHYPDSIWISANGSNPYRSHGWAEEGWAEYAWPGKTGSFGQAVRADLAQIWSEFDLAGFALDCAIGDTRYYGKLALDEPSKAFDENGKVFVLEGTALAHNMTYTRNLPAKADGRRAASIINEPYVYLPAFYCDASIHEMTPFDRFDVIAPRRMMLGQKPYYWWKGFRIDAVLDWEKITPQELHAGLSGIVKYVILSTLRFGAVPAIFYERGFEDMVKYRPLFVRLQKLGWRAAPYAEVANAPKNADPYAADAPYWISRYGEGGQSTLVLSAPDPAEQTVEFKIFTGKFGAGNQLYAPLDGTPAQNTVAPGVTTVKVTLKNQIPVILEPVGEASIGIHTARYTPPKSPIHYQPKNVAQWIESTDFADKKQLHSAIAAKESEFAAIDPAGDQLKVYFEYYFTRIVQPYQRLWGMDGRWSTKFRMQVLAPDSAEAKASKVLFVLGESARKHYFPQVFLRDTIVMSEVDGQKRIAFFPGEKSENELISDFLTRLDVKYPFYGGNTEAWALKSKPALYGKNFSTETPLETPAPAAPAPATPAAPAVKKSDNKLQVLRPDDQTILLRSPLGNGKDLSIKLTTGNNGQLDYGVARQVNPSLPLSVASINAGEVFHHCTDETAPLKANYTYIGGNHGAFVVVDADIAGHGFTEADLGKELQSENGRRYYPVKIISPDRVQLLSENLSKTTIWNFDRASIKNQLTNPATGKVYTVTKVTQNQLLPGMRMVKREILLDQVPLLPGTEAKSGKELEIIEICEIIAPDTALDNLTGKSQDKTPYATVENHYRFDSAMHNSLKQKVKFHRDTTVDQIAGLQSQMLTPPKDRSLIYLVPKTLPFVKNGQPYDFSSGQVISGPIPPTGLFFSESEKNLADPANKPDRFIQLIAREGRPELGFAMGYELDEQPRRSADTGTAMWIWTSKKSYPLVLDGKKGKTTPAGFELEFNVYRNYFVPELFSKNAASAYLIPHADSERLYLDYTQPISGDVITLPQLPDGTPVKVLEASPGVKLSTDEVQNGVLKVDSSEKNGYIVLSWQKK